MHPLRVVGILLLAIIVWLPAVASAHTVTGHVRYWDNRTNRHNSSKLTVSSAQTNRFVGLGAYVALYDLDGACIDFKDGCAENDDDYLDFVTLNNVFDPGGYGIGDIGNGEDLYLLFFYYDVVEGHFAFEESGSLHYVVSEPVLMNIASDVTLDFNVTCPDNARNNVQGLCDSQSDVDSFFGDEQELSNLFASMQAFVDNSVAQAGFWPDGPGNECLMETGASWDNRFCTTSGRAAYTVAHEMGHNAMRGQFDGEVSLSEGTCGASHSWGSLEGEKCATSEGFANFAATATWWTWNATVPLYNAAFPVEGDTIVGNSSPDKCVSLSLSPFQPHRREANVTRFFWDLFDSTENGTDETTTTDGEEHIIFSSILGIWGEFDSGTDDGQYSESGNNGRNVYDYISYDSPYDFTQELNHNCLGSQDN